MYLTFYKKILFFVLILLSTNWLSGQKDTAFWFVAPEVSQSVSNYDRPILLKFSTYDAPAIITVTQPANLSFPTLTLNLSAGTTGELDLSDYIDMIENKPANQVLDYGLYVSATSPVSGYYEILGVCECNPEICSLKGKHALGTTFYVPFQNFLSNGNVTDPAKAAFDIVATEDNTAITIIPTTNLVGHPADIPFNITLDKGETYSCVAQGTSPGAHPGGTKVSSDKPIAITMKDDLLNGGAYFGGSCLDLVADQIVPVSSLGKRYVVMKGQLSEAEKAFVVATSDNTSILVNGIAVSTINEGETYSLDITGYHFIEASELVYLLQVTGVGCETSGEILPSLDCTGSSEVRFIRSTPENFSLFLITHNGNEDAFTLNGNASIIQASDFNLIPGSAGEFVGAVISLSNAVVITGQSTLVENSEGLFHLGFLNGNVSVTGSRFGFFSDYLAADTIEQQYYMCQGDSVLIGDTYVYGFGVHYDPLSIQPGCFQITAFEILPADYLYINNTIELCAGDTFFISNHYYIQNGVYLDTLPSLTTCDSIITTQLIFQDYNTSVNDIQICYGDTLFLNGLALFDPGVYFDTINGGNACDTVLIINLSLTDYIQQSELINLCLGDTLLFNGVPLVDSGIYVDTLVSSSSCDTILTVDLSFNFITAEQIQDICFGDTFYINQLPVLIPGIYTDTISSAETCDTIATIYLTYFEESEDFIAPSDTFICPEQQIQLVSQYVNTIWSTGQTGISIDIFDPDIITAYASNDRGCLVKDTAVIGPCCSNDFIYFPNAFSPNNDQINDFFCPFSGSLCHTISFKVFDRWGELIFESTEMGMCWDGTFRQKNCPIEVYVWLAEIADDQGNTNILKGDVTLLR